MINLEETSEDINTLLLIDHIFAALSFIGCSIIIVFFLKTRKSWTYSGKLIICLVFSNLIQAIINLVSLINSDLYKECQYLGPFRTFAILSSFYWATRISLLAFRAIASNNFDPLRTAKYLFGFSVPFIIALLPIIVSTLGYDFMIYKNIGLHCDISSNEEPFETIWQIIVLIIPMLAGAFMTTYYSIKVTRFLKDYEKTLGIRIWHFLAHPVGLIVSWLPGIVFMIAYLAGYYAVWLDALQIVFSSSSGLINAVIYGWQSLKSIGVRKSMKMPRNSAGVLERFTLAPAGLNEEEQDSGRMSSPFMVM